MKQKTLFVAATAAEAKAAADHMQPGPIEYVRPGLSRAMADVIAERRRHVDGEGWTAEHDDAHRRGEMIMAAVAYGTNAAVQIRMSEDGHPAALIAEKSEAAGPPGIWPWARTWWKPKGGPRRILVKAAALLIAEIERLDRREART